MKNINTLSSALGFLMRATTILASAFLLAGALVSTASASHFRGGQMTWTQSLTGAIELTVQQSWRRTFGPFSTCFEISTGSPVATTCTGPSGRAAVGQIIGATGQLNWGDGTSTTSVYLQVTSIDDANDWFSGTAVDPATGNLFLSHTYTTGGPDYTAFFDSCCRIGPFFNIQNNVFGRFRVETTINTVAINDSPVSTVPPIVGCPVSGACSFSVPSTDPDGDTQNYRLSSSTEAAGTGTFVQPTGAGITAAGLYTTTGALSGGLGDLYSTQIVIEDGGGAAGTSTIAVDFLLELSLPVVAFPDTAGDATGPATGETITIPDVTANDTVPTGVLKIEIVSGPVSGGTAIVGPGFTVDYTSGVTHDGTDTFVYRVIANNLMSDTATVTVNVLTNKSFVQPSTNTLFFNQANVPGSNNPQTAGYQQVDVFGTATIDCCGIVDIREGAGKNNKGKSKKNSSSYLPVDLDLGVQVATGGFNGSCVGMPPIAVGTAMLPPHFRSMPSSTLGIPPTVNDDHVIGVCLFQTVDIVSTGIVYSEENLSNVNGLNREYSCNQDDVDFRLLAGGVSTNPEVEVGPITVECDRGRSGKKNPTIVYAYGIRHDTGILASKQYVLGLIKTLDHVIKAATCVDNSQGFVDDVRGLVQGAKSDLENPKNGKKGKGKTAAQDAVDKFDDATKLVLGITASSPPEPYAACVNNEVGDHIGQMMRTRYAICSEMLHTEAFDADKSGLNDDCLIIDAIRNELPDL